MFTQQSADCNDQFSKQVIQIFFRFVKLKYFWWQKSEVFIMILIVYRQYCQLWVNETVIQCF